MILLCCVLKYTNAYSIGNNTKLVYRYFDTESRQVKDLDTLVKCDNVSSSGKCLGFSIKDITVDMTFGGKYGFLGVEEFFNKNGKITHLGVLDFRNGKVCVVPIEQLLESCELFKSSVLCNYSYVDGKYLRKKPSAVIAKKSIDEYTNSILLSQDTFSSMSVNTLKTLLKSRGMKLGGVCASMRVNYFNEADCIQIIEYNKHITFGGNELKRC